MWSVFVLVYLSVFRVDAQKGPGGRPYDNGHGWDIRYAVPGEPEKDYPTLSEIPRTSFTCSKKEPGYYADVETDCQVFRICTLGSTYGFQSFLCPNGTLFNQAVFVCDWWMNVNCKKAPEYFNSNEKHSQLRVGPELMTDVKMMLTHPMRNPYDKTALNNKLVVSQEYIPPYRIVNANDNNYRFNENERSIDNFYLQPKSANIRQEHTSNDLSFAASTGTPFYSANSNNFQRNTPRQFQNYATFETIVAHPTSAQVTYYNQNAEKQRLLAQNQQKLQQQKQQYLNTNEYRFSSGNNNELQYLRKPNQIQSANLVKQPTSNNFQVPKRVFGNKIPKEYSTSNRNVIQNTVTKQNIDLVYSIIADSINSAKQYSNIALQETSSTQPTTTQEQNIDNNEVEQFSDKVTQLTSSQYTQNNNGRTNQRQQQLRSNEQVSIQNDESGIFNQKNILSGQLYQLPVPVVTKQIYNAPLKNAWTQSRQNLVESRNGQKSNYFLQQIRAPQKTDNENLELQSTGRTDDEEKTLDNAFESEFIKHIKNSNNRIAARIHDKTVGTINHPSEDNKAVSYNKDKTYYVYTQLKTNENLNAIPIKQSPLHKDELNLHHVTHLSTKLRNADSYNNNQIRNNYVAEQDNVDDYNQRSKAKLESTSNVDFEVEHRVAEAPRNNEPKLSRLYDGPSSYTAPQNSIGNLQNQISPNYNSRLEDLENNNNNIDNNNNFNGYSRDRPSKRFLF
ncbi:probable cyclin-dependent serine/threonine-protein kinase DDB_G0292550 [Aricia agestis]|uniref:probable cyclin-dependent serine/threonine-protein kinase DDB_G0292550 n=1 Tax=Aricia agestis TaxID=91739 RepID=UPI001C209BE6|nr:probable cyclin-dependent serine/threonine-protein kinase DDB_G0292550 [Aricia agestis]